MSKGLNVRTHLNFMGDDGKELWVNRDNATPEQRQGYLDLLAKEIEKRCKRGDDEALVQAIVDGLNEMGNLNQHRAKGEPLVTLRLNLCVDLKSSTIQKRLARRQVQEARKARTKPKLRVVG